MCGVPNNRCRTCDLSGLWSARLGGWGALAAAVLGAAERVDAIASEWERVYMRSGFRLGWAEETRTQMP